MRMGSTVPLPRFSQTAALQRQRALPLNLMAVTRCVETRKQRELIKMSFSDYRNYSSTELETIFKIEVIADGDLFGDLKSSGKDYPDLQAKVDLMESRISISTDAGNEATRSSLLFSPSSTKP